MASKKPKQGRKRLPVVVEAIEQEEIELGAKMHAMDRSKFMREASLAVARFGFPEEVLRTAEDVADRRQSDRPSVRELVALALISEMPAITEAIDDSEDLGAVMPYLEPRIDRALAFADAFLGRSRGDR